MCSTHSYPFLTEDSILSENEDIDEIMGFLLELCEGEVLRSIICDAVVQECLDVSQSGQELRRVDSEPSSSSFHFLSAVCSCDGASDCYEHETTSFLDLLLDVVIKLDFPEKMVTFLLQLLPDQEYKVQYVLHDPIPSGKYNLAVLMGVPAISIRSHIIKRIYRSAFFQEQGYQKFELNKVIVLYCKKN